VKLGKLFKHADFKYLLPIISISIITRVCYFLWRLIVEQGVPKTQDSHWYLDHAGDLLSGARFHIDFNGILYFGYYGLLAVFLAIFKSETVFVLLQVLVNALSVIFVYKISEMLLNKRTAVIASLIYALTYELIYWSAFLLTDSLFVSVLLMTVYFLLKSFNTKRKADIFIFSAGVAYMCFIRPSGIVTIAFIFVYIFINMDLKKITSLIISYRRYILVCTVISASLGFIIIYRGFLNPFVSSLYWNLRWLLLDNYSSGRIFDVKTPYDHVYNAVKENSHLNNFVISFFIDNWKHILILYGKRLLGFWGTWMWNYNLTSPAGIIKFVVRLSPVIAMLTGILRIIRQKIYDRTSILILMIVSTQLFCTIFFIDSAWRYRLPSLAFVGILTGYGIDWLLCVFERHFNQKLSFGFVSDKILNIMNIKS